jgi:uncharacterized RDD family membrane protein YckC
MPKWVAISQEQAKVHPKFGIKGLAQFFRVISVVTPGLWFLSAIGSLKELIDARGSIASIDYLLLIPPVIFFLWSGWNARLLGKHSTAFFPSFYALLAFGPVLIVVTRLFWMANVNLEVNLESNANAVASGFLAFLIAWAFWSALLVLYLALSRRINVTLRNRVRTSDKFLSSISGAH